MAKLLFLSHSRKSPKSESFVLVFYSPEPFSPEWLKAQPLTCFSVYSNAVPFALFLAAPSAIATPLSPRQLPTSISSTFHPSTLLDFSPYQSKKPSIFLVDCQSLPAECRLHENRNHCLFGVLQCSEPGRVLGTKLALSKRLLREYRNEGRPSRHVLYNTG